MKPNRRKMKDVQHQEKMILDNLTGMLDQTRKTLLRKMPYLFYQQICIQRLSMIQRRRKKKGNKEMKQWQ